MNYSFDRREDNDLAVLVADDETILNVPLADLPEGCQPGDMLTRLEDGSFVRDDAETEARRSRILDLQKRLRRS